MFAWRRVCKSLYQQQLVVRSTRCLSSATAEAASAEVYCTDLLRKYDVPSYTLLAFIPAPARTAYLAVRALNIEIARVADAVSTSQVGALRLQFWKDNVSNALEGRPSKHPVPLLITAAQERLATSSASVPRFSKSWFLRVITAREQYLNNSPYPSLDALESYAENTYSTLMYLTLQAIPMSSVTADHVASHVGKASGIAAVLKGLPLVAFPSPPNHHSNSAGLATNVNQERQRSSQGAVVLPLDIMAQCGVREEDVLRQGADAPGLKDAVFQVATRANDHLITARTMVQTLRGGQDIGHDFEHGDESEHRHAAESSQLNSTAQQLANIDRAFGVFMPAISTGLWLEKLQQLNFDVFQDQLRRGDWRLPWKAYWAHRGKRL